MLHALSLKTRNTVKNVTWSELNHPSLSERSTGCTRQDIGREHSILQYVTLMLDVYKVCTVSVAVSKWELFLSRIGMKVNGQYCWDIFTSSANVRCYCCVVCNNFVVQQHSALVHLAFKSKLLQCKALNFFLLNYGPLTVQSLTLLTVRCRESYSSMSMSCK